MSLRRTLVVAACAHAVVFGTACVGARAPSLPVLERLPSGEVLVVGATLDGGPTIYRWVVLGFDGASPGAWQLRGGRGLTEGGSSCIGNDEEARWEADRGALLLRGHLGCAAGTYRLAPDGTVEEVGLPALPAQVQHPSAPIVAPDGRVAVVGTTWADGRAGVEHLYVARPGEAPVTIGADLGFEDITFPRWSADGSAVFFVGATRDAGAYQRRAWVADAASGAARRIADAEVRIDAAPIPLPDGGVVFAAASGGAPPAIFRAGPGASATTWVTLDALPEPARWRGGLWASPDGRRVALRHVRENAALTETIYVVDLDAQVVRDALPGDLAPARTGASAKASPPSVEPLGWSPDGERVVFASDLRGDCRAVGPVGAASCGRHLYAVPAAGGPPQRLSELAFASVRFGVWIP